MEGNAWSSTISYDGDDGKPVGLDLDACVLPHYRDRNYNITYHFFFLSIPHL